MLRERERERELIVGAMVTTNYGHTDEVTNETRTTHKDNERGH